MSLFRKSRNSRKSRTNKNIESNKPVRIKSEYVGLIDVPTDETKQVINYETDEFKRYFFLINDHKQPVFTKHANLIPIYVGYDDQKPYFYMDPILYKFFRSHDMTKRNTSSAMHGLKRGFKIAAAIAPVAAIIPEPHVVSLVATVAGTAGTIGGIYKGYSKAKGHKRGRSNIANSRNTQNSEYKTILIGWDYFNKNFKPVIEPNFSKDLENTTNELAPYVLAQRRLDANNIKNPTLFNFDVPNSPFLNIIEGKHVVDRKITEVGFITRKDIKGFTVNLNNTVPTSRRQSTVRNEKNEQPVETEV